MLLDVTMRDMDGIEVLNRIRELDPAAAVIIVTADVQSSTREMAPTEAPLGFVIKPIQPAELLSAVDNALHGATS